MALGAPAASALADVALVAAAGSGCTSSSSSIGSRARLQLGSGCIGRATPRSPPHGCRDRHPARRHSVAAAFLVRLQRPILRPAARGGRGGWLGTVHRVQWWLHSDSGRLVDWQLQSVVVASGGLGLVRSFHRRSPDGPCCGSAGSARRPPGGAAEAARGGGKAHRSAGGREVSGCIDRAKQRLHRPSKVSSCIDRAKQHPSQHVRLVCTGMASCMQ